MQEADYSDLERALNQLTDLFQRRLLDDKVKAKTIETLSDKLDGRFMLPLFRELILLLDRLDTFLTEEPESESYDFVCSIYEELLIILQHYGLSQIETSPTFDFKTQKAVGVVEQAGCDDQQIMQVVRRGYLYEESLLRPEEVVITRRAGDVDNA